MAGVVWWIQVVGGALSIVLAGGAILAGIYTSVRDAPTFVRRLTGVRSLENKFDQLHSDHLISQELQLQQAEAFNELSETVCEHHEIPEDNRPQRMNTAAIRQELMGRDDPDFTRGD